MLNAESQLTLKSFEAVLLKCLLTLLHVGSKTTRVNISCTYGVKSANLLAFGNIEVPALNIHV